MLRIFNNLKPFFEDNYRRINVREYARLTNISPPSASTLLKELKKEGLLKGEKERNYIFYVANREDKQFIDLSKIYWSYVLRKVGLLGYLEKEFLNLPLIILFGSLSKAEVKKDSDVDLAIFAPSKKSFSLGSFERKLKRKIQIFIFKSKEEVKNKELLNNILNGHILEGNW